MMTGVSALCPVLNRHECSEVAWSVACSEQTSATVEQFLDITNLLLERVQLNSTHLFRADILFDSTAELSTVKEKEAKFEGLEDSSGPCEVESPNHHKSHDYEPPEFERFQHRRTVVRRLIPRKPQLDEPLEQSCFIYNGHHLDDINHPVKILVLYQPHCQREEDMPWYHPKVKSLAYLYSSDREERATLSVHYLQFSRSSSPLPDRLERTFLSLLGTMLRLLRQPSAKAAAFNAETNDVATMPLTPASLKDTILPQHIVQDTYTRLKQTYASDLMSRWIEKTEPSKHVFEDLSIAAFLIELWRKMYKKNEFPGFMDIACGNGVLVYILIKEGFKGYGFDARKRKTWEILGIEQHIHEQICIPKPFLDLRPDEVALRSEMNICDGIFEEGTFIISNHADELTCWTPILSVLSCPEAPLPFLAIPCCSHALDGSRRRYTIKDVMISRHSIDASTTMNTTANSNGDILEEQPTAGDLKAMRAAKQKGTADDKSMYACLTRKTVSLAQELGCSTELTLMRIPSTRNIGIVGNKRRDLTGGMSELRISDGGKGDEKRDRRIDALIERECSGTGGIEASAHTWIEKAKKLQGGQGRGKVNLNAHVHGHQG